MPLFIASQRSLPVDHDMTAEMSRMIANATDEAAAMDLFPGFAQQGHIVELTSELPNKAWIDEQMKVGKLKSDDVMAYSAPLK